MLSQFILSKFTLRKFTLSLSKGREGSLREAGKFITASII